AENIKDKVFFISSLDPAFACQTINPETEGGRIYIALKNCNYVYIYNIEEKSIVTSRPFSNLPENLYYSRWFMPDTGMTGTLKEGIGKSHQIREKESKSDAVYLKDAGDKAHNKSELPLDVIEVIPKYINDVLAYLQFRASNKRLRLVAPQIQWRSSSTMSRFDDLSMCPLFVFSEKDKVFTFVHPKHGLDYKNIINYPQGINKYGISDVLACQIPQPLLNV
ncbi:F-box protein, partial [Trifolium pratense]